MLLRGCAMLPKGPPPGSRLTLELTIIEAGSQHRAILLSKSEGVTTEQADCVKKAVASPAIQGLPSGQGWRVKVDFLARASTEEFRGA